MNNNILYILLFLGSVFISSVSQVLLKKSADMAHENRVREYLNPRVIFAYGLFFLSTVMTMLAYKHVPLSAGPVLEATAYVWVSLLSLLFLKEKINKQKWIGLAVIVIGIIVFSL